MIAADESALICDMAETYGILDYRRLPARTAAALASGLQEDARVKRKISGSKVPMEILLLAAIKDELSTLVWMQTKDGAAGRNRPKSLVKLLAGEEKTDDVQAFSSGQEFERKRRQLLGEEVE